MAPATELPGRADRRPARPPRCGERVRPRRALDAADGARGGEDDARAWRLLLGGEEERGERSGGVNGKAEAALLLREREREREREFFFF